jgi:glycosyltransferase involved in cell wall biosynthesis
MSLTSHVRQAPQTVPDAGDLGSREFQSSGPLVSVITPTLNQGRFIESTLRSVMGQTYPHIEHIVVDGGSMDRTLQVLAAYQDRYRLRWISEPDSGMYDALNKGLQLAQGDIIAYLNSDDVWLPWAAEVAVEHLTGPGGKMMVYGDALRVDDATHSVRFYFLPPLRGAYLRTIGSFAQPATFWRREVHDAVGDFDGSLQFAGDLDFYLRVADQFAIGRIDEFLAVMRLHPEMKTSALAERSRDENRVVRARRGMRPTLARVLGDRFQAWWGRRRLWLAFAMRARQSALASDTRWARFLAAGNVRVSVGRVLLAQMPVVGLRIPAIALSDVDWLATPSPPFLLPQASAIADQSRPRTSHLRLSPGSTSSNARPVDESTETRR